MTKQEKINIRPGVRILSLFKHMNYQPWYALAELVDNALASFLANREELERVSGGTFQFRVVIEMEESGIRVWDNAAGIGVSDFDRAFVTAEPPPDATGLSQYGIGMKSANCWFARKWQVTTCALGEGVERTISFDVPSIVENNTEELSTTSKRASPSAHYTEIRLWELYKPPQTRTVAKIREHLASMYRIFIERGEMLLEFNGSPLRYQEPKVLFATQYDLSRSSPVIWKKNIDFKLPTGESVRGFAAIREKGSVGNAGFALFRNNRLIIGSPPETYRPKEIFGASNSFTYQRVFGELDLVGFDVSHTKDGFLWGDKETVFLSELRNALNKGDLPILRQAENYRSRQPSGAVKAAAKSAVVSTARATSESGPTLAGQIGSTTEDDPPRKRLSKADDVSQKTLTILMDGQCWEVAIELVNDPSATDWLVVKDQTNVRKKRRTLSLRLSLSHPFMLQFAGSRGESIEPLLRVAVALGLAEISARASGAGMVGLVRRNVNDLLRGPLSEPG